MSGLLISSGVTRVQQLRGVLTTRFFGVGTRAIPAQNPGGNSISVCLNANTRESFSDSENTRFSNTHLTRSIAMFLWPSEVSFHFFFVQASGGNSFSWASVISLGESAHA